MAKRKGIVVFNEWFDLMIEVLEPEQTIELLKLIRAEMNGEQYESKDLVVNTHWFHMYHPVNKSIENYDNKVKTNRKNGKKGGAPKGNKNASKQPKQPKTTENNPNNLKNKNMNTYSYQNMVVSSEETSYDDVPSSEMINTL
jgi:hypothetical protein